MHTEAIAGALHPDYRLPVRHLARPRPDRFVLSGLPSLTYKQTDRLRSRWVQRAREDFGAFCEYALRDRKTGLPFQLQWFHEDWIEAVEANQLSMIVAPRGHGKTDLMIGYVVWRLGRNPNLIVKLVCEDDVLAIKRLKAIRKLIEKNPRVREVFPELKPDHSEGWKNTQLFVERSMIDKEPSVEAKGVTAGATGSRVDLLIADDIVGRRNALTVPKLREGVKVAWNDDWMNLCDDESQVVYICTLWHRDDNSHEMIERGQWHLLFYAVGDDFGSLWPEKWGEAALRAKHAVIGSIPFARGYKNQCRDDSTALIREDMIQYIDLEELPPMTELVFFNSYDPAKAVKEDADFTAEVIVAVDPEEELVYVVDARHAHITKSQQSNWIYRGWRKFKPERILIEDIGTDLCDWVEHDHPEMKGIVEPVKPKISKYYRLEAVTPLFERGQVLISSRLNPDDPRFKPQRGSLVAELFDFGFARNDDLADALTQALDAVRYYVLDRPKGKSGTLVARINKPTERPDLEKLFE